MRINQAIHPTYNQKRVLAKIIAAPTPTVAAQSIIGDQNLVAARSALMKLGLVTLSNGESSVTDRGIQVATDENIVDAGGELSQVGQELAYGDVAQPAGPVQQAPMESFSLLKELLS